jgi:hypothetical protein
MSPSHLTLCHGARPRCAPPAAPLRGPPLISPNWASPTVRLHLVIEVDDALAIAEQVDTALRDFGSAYDCMGHLRLGDVGGMSAIAPIATDRKCALEEAKSGKLLYASIPLTQSLALDS